jgi:DNA-binding transcriptional regulator YiaG
MSLSKLAEMLSIVQETSNWGHGDLRNVASPLDAGRQASRFAEPRTYKVAPPKVTGLGQVTTLALFGMAFVCGSVGAGHTSTVLPASMINPYAQATTTSGYRREKGFSASVYLSEVRLRLGVTWAELAAIFNVSRRSVHLWASGEKLSERNEAELRRVHWLVTHSGDIAATKQSLLAGTEAANAPRNALKGAILSSHELGIVNSTPVVKQRVSLDKLRRL